MSSHERNKTFYGRDVWETGVNDYKVSYLTMQNSVDAGTNLADNVLGSRRRSCTSSAVFFFEGRATGPILLTGCNRISKKRTPAIGQVSQAKPIAGAGTLGGVLHDFCIIATVRATVRRWIVVRIKICRIDFPTKARAEAYIRGILESYPRNCTPRPNCAGHALREEHRAFVYDILRLHRHFETIAGSGVREIRVQHIKDGAQARFMLVRGEYDWRDFSWRDALYPRDHKQDVHKVCRSLVRDQISRFKDRAFGPLEILHCPVTGEVTDWSGSDVDHIPPDTFEALVEEWLQTLAIKYEDVEIVPSPNYEEESTFLDTVLSQTWREYHRKHAKLRVVSAFANRSVIRKGSGHGKRA